MVNEWDFKRKKDTLPGLIKLRLVLLSFLPERSLSAGFYSKVIAEPSSLGFQRVSNANVKFIN